LSFVHQDPEFGDLLARAAARRDIAVELVEKDHWVTHTLWSLQRQGFELWFKGGTSLSKGFGIIERFSEDLDLKIEPGLVRGVPPVQNWKSESRAAAAARRDYFEALADRIQVAGAELRLDVAGSDPTFRAAALQVRYPGKYLAALGDAFRPFVLLEVGNARVTPSVPCDLASFVQEELQILGLLGEYDDDRPRALRCVHPLVTLLEKLDALRRRVPDERVAPARFVRHYEDAARIIRAEVRLPALEGYADVRALAEEMLGARQIAGIPGPLDGAFTPAQGQRGDSIRVAWEEIGPMFWGERITLADACAEIRAWVARRLGRSPGPAQGES
jgi:hypothetical protein